MHLNFSLDMKVTVIINFYYNVLRELSMDVFVLLTYVRVINILNRCHLKYFNLLS